MNEPRFEVYPRKHLAPNWPREPVGDPYEFGWRFRAANGQITAIEGEGFTRRVDAHRAVNDFCSRLADLFYDGERPAIDELSILDVDE